MSNIFNIAVVGAGQLGSRHLQSLKQIELPVNLYVIDANEESLVVAKTRYDQIDNNENVKSILFSSNIEDLPSVVDLIVLATSSRGRASLIESLFDQSEVKNIIIEKVLFQTENEYFTISRLIKDRNINAWINCPRRLYPIYKMLNERLKDCKMPILGVVDGSNWGLGCNSIHYVDIFAQLAKCNEYSLSTNGLNLNVINSKREGYIEFNGTLNLNFENGSSLMITSREQEGISSSVFLSAGDKKFFIDEDAKKLFCLNASGEYWDSLSFEIPFQSQLTASVAMDILLNKSCGLTSYTDSMQIHLPFIRGLVNFLKEHVDANIKNCPIT